MNDKVFKEPELTIKKVYTRQGDTGLTRLVGGQQLPKNHPRIVAYGEVDELNATIGGCLVQLRKLTEQFAEVWQLQEIITRVQHELFNLGTGLATMPKDLTADLPQITARDVVQLETDIDHFNTDLPALRSFVLPGASEADAWFHLARTVCRRVERHMIPLIENKDIEPVCLKYTNRLSDALFVWGRWVTVKTGHPENVWQPNMATSGKKKSDQQLQEYDDE